MPVLTLEQWGGCGGRGEKEGIKLRLRQHFLRSKISNYAEVNIFWGEGVSNYTLEQLQKRLRQQFSRAKISNYAEVSNFGGESIRLRTCAAAKARTQQISRLKISDSNESAIWRGCLCQQFWRKGGIKLHKCAAAKARSQQFSRLKNTKILSYMQVPFYNVSILDAILRYLQAPFAPSAF